MTMTTRFGSILGKFLILAAVSAFGYVGLLLALRFAPVAGDGVDTPVAGAMLGAILGGFLVMKLLAFLRKRI